MSSGRLFIRGLTMEYDLKWENYKNWTENCISQLSEDKRFSDVTLMSDDLQTFKAHKIILSKSSAFFSNVLESMPLTSNNTLFLKGVDGTILKSMLKFVYEGLVSVPEEGLSKFLETGFDLKIVGIISGKESVMRKKMPEELMKDTIKQKVVTTPSKIMEESLEERNEKVLIFTNPKGIVEENFQEPKEKIHITQTKIMEESFQDLECHLSKTKEDLTEKGIKITTDGEEEEVQIKEEFSISSNTSEENSTIKLQHYPVATLNITEVKFKSHHCTFDPNVCNKQFTLKSNLKQHIEKKHLGTVAKRFECPDCPRKFYTRNEVTLHFDRKHRDLEKKHPCGVCGKKFYQAGDVKAHVKGVHDKIKDFQCNFCDLAFSQGCNLKTHIRKIHTSKN